MNDVNKCPKCGGEFEKGVTKSTSGYAGKTKWGTGYGKFLGMLAASVKNSRDIVTLRCKNCGYLESYAN